MAVALYEFPLCEKVRNYLRLEQLINQLKQAAQADSEYQYLYFFEVLFDFIDLVERLDLRSDFIRDIDQQEKNLVHWSQHPDIDSSALQVALDNLRELSAEVKSKQKLGSGIRNEVFLNSIRQRFAIPGGVNSFDLPNLYCWLYQPNEIKQAHIARWIAHLSSVENCITLLLSFLRERGQFREVVAKNAFYQGNVEDKNELVRVKCDNTQSHYPVLSGNKYRYGIKFMSLKPEDGDAEALSEDVTFQIASC